MRSHSYELLEKIREKAKIRRLQSSLENKKESIKLKLDNLISIGIYRKDLLNELENIYNSYTKETLNGVLINQRKLMIKIENTLNHFSENLSNFNFFIGLYDQFQIYRKSLQEKDSNLFKKMINNYVEDIILDLESFKEKDEFQDERYTRFIYNIYEISYSYMKYEFIYKDSSLLFDYFNNNLHDFWYINEFIKRDIEELTSSINYIEGLDELTNIISNNRNHLMDKKIILALCKCELREEYTKASEIKLKEYYDKFKKIYHKLFININDGILPKDYFKNLNIRKVKKEYLTLLKEYHKFINDNNFFKETNEQEILRINNMKLSISQYLEITEEELNGIYKVKSKNFK